jgi:hypothetical protein
MATAAHKGALFRTEQIEVSPRAVVLTLSVKEAQTLRDVCNKIGGDPATTRRGNMDGIKKALESVGFLPSDLGDTRDHANAIYFD